jgi:hypothetical protein
MVELDEADFEDPEDLADEEPGAAGGLELEGLDETVEAEDELVGNDRRRGGRYRCANHRDRYACERTRRGLAGGRRLHNHG